jgi:hypothetical protein
MVRAGLSREGSPAGWEAVATGRREKGLGSRHPSMTVPSMPRLVATVLTLPIALQTLLWPLLGLSLAHLTAR